MWLVRPAVLTQVLGIVYRAISPFLIRRAGLRVGAGARTGAVTLIQRFGSARNLNIQLQTTTPILPQLFNRRVVIPVRWVAASGGSHARRLYG